MPAIRIDDEVYALLQKDAQPFEDTPNSVLRRKLGLEKQKKGQPQQMKNFMIIPNGILNKKTPQNAFRNPILKVLKKLGGEGLRPTVLESVEKAMEGALTEYDKSDIRSGTIRWQKSAEWEVRAMREQGILKPVHETPRGIWALTKKGSEEASVL